MKISVVIPAFNAANCIGKAIESCYHQSLAPFEIIVVSDGSKDETPTFVSVTYPEIKLLILPENKGVAHARNVGIALAKGEWIAFLDADDQWHPDKLKTLAWYANNFPKASAFIHTFSLDKFKPLSNPKSVPAQKVSFFKILLQNKVQGSSICLKNNTAFYFNEQFRYCEDHELALKLAWKNQLYFFPLQVTKLGRAQLSKGGLSGNRWAMRKGEIKMYSQIGQRNPLLAFFVPFLIFFSLVKHLLKGLKTEV